MNTSGSQEDDEQESRAHRGEALAEQKDQPQSEVCGGQYAIAETSQAESGAIGYPTEFTPGDTHAYPLSERGLGRESTLLAASYPSPRPLNPWVMRCCATFWQPRSQRGSEISHSPTITATTAKTIALSCFFIFSSSFGTRF